MVLFENMHENLNLQTFIQEAFNMIENIRESSELFSVFK